MRKWHRAESRRGSRAPCSPVSPLPGPQSRSCHWAQGMSKLHAHLCTATRADMVLAKGGRRDEGPAWRAANSVPPLPALARRFIMGALLCRREALRMDQDFIAPPGAAWAAHQAAHVVRNRPPAASLLEACLRAFAEQPERFEHELPRIPQARLCVRSAVLGSTESASPSCYDRTWRRSSSTSCRAAAVV